VNIFSQGLRFPEGKCNSAVSDSLNALKEGFSV